MAIKVGMVSLGCAKNQVDGEMLMANLKTRALSCAMTLRLQTLQS